MPPKRSTSVKTKKTKHAKRNPRRPTSEKGRRRVTYSVQRRPTAMLGLGQSRPRSSTTVRSRYTGEPVQHEIGSFEDVMENGQPSAIRAIAAVAAEALRSGRDPLTVAKAGWEAGQEMRTARAVAGTKRRGAPDNVETKTTIVAAPAAYLRDQPTTYHSEPRRVRHTEGNVTHDAIEFKAREYLGLANIDTSNNSLGAALVSLPIAPARFQSTRAQTYSRMYQMCRITDCTLYYSGTGPTTWGGQVAGYFDPDPADLLTAGEAGIKVASNHPGYAPCHIVHTAAWRMPKAMNRSIWCRDTGFGFSTTGAYDAEIRDTVQGTFRAIVAAPVTGTTIPAPTDAPLAVGSWHVEYTIRFFLQAIDDTLVGSFETNLNWGYGSDVSGPWYTKRTTSVAGWFVTNHPIAEQDPTTALTQGEGYSCWGDYPESFGWHAATLAQVTAWGPSNLAAWMSSTSGSATALTTWWLPAFPSVASMLTINFYLPVAGTVAAAETSVGIAVVNPDDSGSTVYQLVLLSTGASTATVGDQGYAAPTINAFAAYIGATWVSATVTLVIDPSSFRYNPSKLLIQTWLQSSTNGFTAAQVHLDNAAYYCQYIFSSMSVQQRTSWGIPAYAPRSTQLRSRVPVMTDLGLQVSGQATFSQLATGARLGVQRQSETKTRPDGKTHEEKLERKHDAPAARRERRHIQLALEDSEDYDSARQASRDQQRGLLKGQRGAGQGVGGADAGAVW
jgi:hypothetical protein